MNNKRNTKLSFWSTLAVAVGMLSQSSFAGVISDIEGNGTIANALNINSFFSVGANPDIQDSLTLPWVSIMSAAESADRYDYYSFTALAGTTGLFDIDYGSNAGGSFDSQVHLFKGDGTFLAGNDDSSPADPGSASSLDSFLSYDFTSSDTYVIGVCQFFCSGQDGTMTGRLIRATGTYTLQVSRIPEPTIYSLLALGLTGLFFAVRRRKTK